MLGLLGRLGRFRSHLLTPHFHNYLHRSLAHCHLFIVVGHHVRLLISLNAADHHVIFTYFGTAGPVAMVVLSSALVLRRMLSVPRKATLFFTSAFSPLPTYRIHIPFLSTSKQS